MTRGPCATFLHLLPHNLCRGPGKFRKAKLNGQIMGMTVTFSAGNAQLAALSSGLRSSYRLLCLRSWSSGASGDYAHGCVITFLLGSPMLWKSGKQGTASTRMAEAGRAVEIRRWRPGSPRSFFGIRLSSGLRNGMLFPKDLGPATLRAFCC